MGRIKTKPTSLDIRCSPVRKPSIVKLDTRNLIHESYVVNCVSSFILKNLRDIPDKVTDRLKTQGERGVILFVNLISSQDPIH